MGKSRNEHDKTEKSVIDHVADELTNPDANTGNKQAPVTPDGKPVEEQVCKEWDPKRRGGLPTFLQRRAAR
jgi:hypothetical protein